MPADSATVSRRPAAEARAGSSGSRTIAARITKSFGAADDSVAFRLQVEFEAKAGVTVLFGPSGAGKTLTLDCIAGFTRPDSGRILADDRLLFDGESDVNLRPQARRCGYVFQNYALFPHMSLRKNLEFAARALPRVERHRRVGEMLERFRLGDVAGRRPAELSGGQKQRCSIARALIGAPAFLLLDEPARGLDAALRGDFYEALREARAEYDSPAILVTHDIDECLELGDQVLVISNGRIVQQGRPRDVVDHPATAEVARLLGLYRLVPAEIVALDPGRGSSRVRIGDAEVQGPYFRGRLIGDHVQICAMPSRLRAQPRIARASPSEVPATLVRVLNRPEGARLEFDNGLAVDGPVPDPESSRPGSEWLIEIPPAAMRAV
jgi:molybdate transport system ATP-binding protein